MKADMVVPMSAAARETTSFSAASIFRSSRAAEAVMVRSFEAGCEGLMGQLVRNFTVWTQTHVRALDTDFLTGLRRYTQLHA
jgi:hypothetical protein